MIAERTRLTAFVARRAARAALGRMHAHPLLRWRFSPAGTDRLLIAPQDLRTADPTRASEIYGGRFAFAGKILSCDGRSPFEMTPPSPEWGEALLGFTWLRHLRAADSAITRSNARALVEDWIALQGNWNALAWRPDIVARRVVSWLTHAPFLLQDADERFYRRFMRSLSRQVRYLRRSSGGIRDGLPRLQGIMALNYAALCMAGQNRLMKTTARRLVDELQRQILPDGGHISRNPGALIDILIDLLPLRQAYGARNIPPPPAMVNAIDRMMPMLRFFRHGDGAFANFNGMGPTQPDQLATVLAYDDARGKPVANAAHSGYQRLDANGVVLIMDAGPPPPIGVSHEAHASALAIEFSARRHRIVVNCGLPATSRDSWRHVARTTAAHSTLGFGDASSCRFLAAESLQRLIGAPIVAGPSAVNLIREDDHDPTLRAAHDGYAAQFGMRHERHVTLAWNGRRLDGEDVVAPVRGGGMPRGVADGYAVRFHLHPSVKATRLTHRHGVMLVLPNRDVWTFEANDGELALEESVFLASREGPRRTVQIVIRANARQTARIGWSFAQLDPGESGVPRAQDAEPELPL